MSYAAKAFSEGAYLSCDMDDEDMFEWIEVPITFEACFIVRLPD